MTTITKEWLQQTIAEFENTRDDIPFGLDDDDAKILIVLKRALASLEREQVRHEHAEWSDATFGDVGPVGPLKHLSKEALEAAADPSDPLEWADMQFLLWDAQRRMGISDEFITRAMIEKLAINKARQWPEPKDGEPRLHIKEQSAPVVPPAIEPDYEVIKSILPTANPDEYACTIAADMWNACRAAMLQGGQPVSNRDELQVIGWLRSDYNSDDKRDPNAPLFMLGSNDPSDAWGVKYIPLSGNSPVIPCGWISCSERMPEDEQEVIVHNKLGYRYVSYFDEHSGLFFDMRGGNQMNCIEHILVTHWMPLPAAPEPEQS
ncbi:DUF550 domain-containing protein [Salmonella enterica subsp. enterica]|nr:DUF550 domain-containing protein [Salmonella enterica subsp. enterica]ECI4400318.1 DUF550 domain-containing protein [Salmonella enterica subsp. enterica]MLQ38814.1 DUF550 domain-containing protein [Salmonella enterica subsp. enterica]